jgi:hypothetical protein
MGTIYTGTSTRAGQELAASTASLVHWGFVGVTTLIILLTIVVGTVLLMK